MARPKLSLENTSLLKALDGGHLKWDVFRTDVLHPFGITFAEATEPDNLPQDLLRRLQERLCDIGRFDHQRQKWRSQTATGQGFSLPTVFPPNILPQVWSASRMQRFLSPKMSREALPRRPNPATSCLFELPSAKPISATAFVTEAFSESEHQAMPSSLSPVGTIVDFATGYVSPGKTLHCPFLVFERCQGPEMEEIEKALNMCAVSGAQCVRGLKDISQRARQNSISDVYSFSCLLNDRMAIINIHTVDDQGKHTMSALHRFDLTIDEHFNSFQAWIQAIEEWACSTLLPSLKDSLTKISTAGDTPPASPMPSLALSIDTEVGNVTGLMAALKRSFPTIAWHGDTALDTPINSSIANCGTPFEGRRSHSFAMSSPTAGSYGNLLLRRNRGQSLVSPINTRNPQFTYQPARPSPFSPRYALISPSACETIVESPCRPGTLSPFTPPPDAPWAAKSPMLVLQKRVEIAMDEVQELRGQVETLQSELAAKNQQISERLSAMEMLQKLQKKAADDKLRAMQLKEQELNQAKKQPKIGIANKVEIYCGWVSSAFKHDGWDLFLEQALFVLALVALTIVCMTAFRDVMAPATMQICFWLGTRLSSLDVLSRWLFDWRRLSKIPDTVPGLDMWQYLDVWRSLLE